MSNVAIRAEKLGKAYLIDRARAATPYRTLREDLVGTIGRLFRRDGAGRERFWALQDLSFELEHGEVVGLIGRNGAGKSTLLKILSRITEPTEGHADVFGRVGSLLEVGTGFHPELSGRENVFLNGAILGMSQREIRARFDEIVQFAEIERFLDTPVKRYSSGMYVRLAFAVAAHLQTEILLVDEVLAVGDLQFQAKCLGKMKDTATSGRTVLFVSHNMAAVRQLCPRSLWIDRGRARDFGETPTVVDRYLQEVRGAAAGQGCFPADERKPVQLREAHLRARAGEETAHFDCDHPVLIDLLLEVRRPVPGLYGYLEVLRSDGTSVLVSDSLDCPPNPLDRLPAGQHRVGVTIPARSLAPGDYDVYLNFASSASEAGFDVDTPGVVASFHLDDFTSTRGNRRHGHLSTLLTWRVADAP